MDMVPEDKVSKEILASSRLQLTNPDFNNMVMKKIMLESHKQSILHNVALYTLIFFSFDTIIYGVMKLMNINLTDIGSSLSAFNYGSIVSIQHSPSNIRHLLLFYFLILAVVIFSMNIISRSRYRYSGI
jgi:hypothetical protein